MQHLFAARVGPTKTSREKVRTRFVRKYVRQALRKLRIILTTPRGDAIVNNEVSAPPGARSLVHRDCFALFMVVMTYVFRGCVFAADASTKGISAVRRKCYRDHACRPRQMGRAH